MPYGDYNGPDKPDKGVEGGSCNRRLCQCAPANFYNHGSYAWYCEDCAHQIGNDPMNRRDWSANYQPRLGHPMFETREQMTGRTATSEGA